MVKKISSAQMRAARALLRWSALDLATASKVGVATIRRVEVVDGEIPVTLANEAALRRAFPVLASIIENHVRAVPDCLKYGELSDQSKSAAVSTPSRSRSRRSNRRSSPGNSLRVILPSLSAS